MCGKWGEKEKKKEKVKESLGVLAAEEVLVVLLSCPPGRARTNYLSGRKCLGFGLDGRNASLRGRKSPRSTKVNQRGVEG